ncbi:MAG: D-aminoacyl-tRNA deacylase [Bacteroidota bacterium]|nr:D-aminoacyl-tRNA deacylase [Bacteroidota bacterium]
MRAIIQRVKKAKVEIENSVFASIKKGLLVFVGIENDDTDEDIKWLAKKIVNMRIFGDENNKMNISLNDINGEILVVSQFTLHASTKKGNRPSYIKAAKPDFAIPVYEKFIKEIEIILNKKVETGKFGAYMNVIIENDGPVTIFVDTKNKN